MNDREDKITKNCLKGSSVMKFKLKPQRITLDIPNKNTFRRNVLSFLHFLDSCPWIKEFLNYDCCFRLADKYLIAMVFIYFQRAGIRPRSYTTLHFFAALCLAHSMEEEDKDLLGEIFPWALGMHHLIELAPYLLNMKLSLWKAIDYRAFVNKYSCQKVMSIWPHHSVWKRKRAPGHQDTSYLTRQTNSNKPCYSL
ncbi:UNVERIFIED_CONTAM: hypothetical protein PYX00_007097 [Menopon gallinae]|uniref:Uncharacterized protein n=1 Tax=Menopon gallinae TaxID=328185 RepID=A0AAW2HHP1_9NEOP